MDEIMDEITLTLKRNTVEGIISIIEDHLHNLYAKAEKYKGQPIEKRIENHIEKWENRIKELEVFMPKDNLDCEPEDKE